MFFYFVDLFSDKNLPFLLSTFISTIQGNFNSNLTEHVIVCSNNLHWLVVDTGILNNLLYNISKASDLR